MVPSNVLVPLQISTICTALIQTRLWKNRFLPWTKFARLARPSTLDSPNAQLRPYARHIRVRWETALLDLPATQLMRIIVAKIDAVQAEYSAFETVHETDDLINATRELGVAYVYVKRV